MKLSVLLFINACFSLANALLLLFYPKVLADFLLTPGFHILGFYGTEVIQVLGIGLVIFGLYVAYIASKIDKLMWHTRIIIMMDWSWVIATLALFIFIDMFSLNGMIYFAIVGGIVGTFAILQARQYRTALHNM